MVAVRGKYNGSTVTLEKKPDVRECEVIVTFLESYVFAKTDDDGSLAYLFKEYSDDGIREPVINFGLFQQHNATETSLNENRVSKREPGFFDDIVVIYKLNY